MSRNAASVVSIPTQASRACLRVSPIALAAGDKTALSLIDTMKEEAEKVEERKQALVEKWSKIAQDETAAASPQQ